MYIYLYTAEKKLLVHIWETHVETLADKEPGKSSFGGLRDQGRDIIGAVDIRVSFYVRLEGQRTRRQGHSSTDGQRDGQRTLRVVSG